MISTALDIVIVIAYIVGAAWGIALLLLLPVAVRDEIRQILRDRT